MVQAVTGGGSDLVSRAGAALLRTRWLARAPIWLYRAGLGAVFGDRLLMLEHVGRTSGRPRYVVLEIIDHPSAGRYIVVSGFGQRAQWYRNVEANPRVRISLAGHRPSPAAARHLDAGDAKASLLGYASAHPGSWEKLRPILEQTLGTKIDQQGAGLPVISIDLL